MAAAELGCGVNAGDVGAKGPGLFSREQDLHQSLTVPVAPTEFSILLTPLVCSPLFTYLLNM